MVKYRRATLVLGMVLGRIRPPRRVTEKGSMILMCLEPMGSDAQDTVKGAGRILACLRIYRIGVGKNPAVGTPSEARRALPNQ